MSFRSWVAVGLTVLTTVSCAGAASAQGCSSEGQVKSADGGAPSEIEFTNSSSEARRLYWITEAGTRRLQSVVQGGAKYRQPTSLGHYWIVTDEQEKCLHLIPATSARTTVEIGAARGAAVTQPPAGVATLLPAPLQATTPATTTAGASTLIDPRLLNGWYEINSVSRQGLTLNTLETSNPVLVRTKPGWHSAQWSFEPVGSDQVRIKNRWKNAYLVVERDALRVAPANVANTGSHWLLESIPGETYGRIWNSGDGRYLISTSRGFDLVSSADNKVDSFWLLQPASSASAVKTPVPIPVKSDPKPKPQPPKTCPTHFTLRDGDCVRKASLCTSREVYSSSVQACIPKEPPKAKPTPSCVKGATWSNDAGKCVPLKCGKNYRLVDGQCKLLQNCGANAYRSPEGDCYCKTGFVKFQGQCVRKSIAQPWTTKACKTTKAACAAGSRPACLKVESLCNPN